ncbi:hypothetical protein [Planomonospora parontospora]|uniref:hypothetical protein n=1 Tax=Planomonospora parontospora TaxID=58119 RepID=UPI0016713753|nr:hypothetical protein [Planomonospora parontospora]GGL37195.1 hypothetical protein GCM10014719_42920 [Planomonospora parontospora subsp. antibiotica]GII17273.1 hypothetical protein Ppa05_39990 [Planomonospora parontospora subsp. antibiotica]
MSGGPSAVPVSRAAWFQWAAAFAFAAAPTAYWMFLGPDSYSYGYVVYGDPARCVGNAFMDDHGHGILQVFYEVPFFEFGGSPLMAGALAAWLAGNRQGLTGIGRVAARAAAAVIGSVLLLPLLPVAVDAALDSNCLDMWGGPLIVSTSLVQGLTALVSLVLMLRAARPPHARRSGAVRAALALLVLLPACFLPVSDGTPGRISGGEVCGEPGREEELRGEARFLCAARGGEWDQGGIADFDGMPDEQVLRYGRHLCAEVTRAGGYAYEPAAYEAVGLSYSVPLADALEAICPKVAEARGARDEQTRLAEEREREELERRCAAYPPHRPRIRPVRRASGAVHTDYNALVALEDEEFEMIEASPLWVKGLVGAEPGILQITVAEEFSTVCVTAEVYDRRPPLERRGWDMVKEIPYRSVRGRLTFVDFYGGRRLVNLTAAGKGDYRVRVHVRGSGQAAAGWGGEAVERFLVMVYPVDK